jgi:N-acetylmuramoyl-L-alanine amidase CwlA
MTQEQFIEQISRYCITYAKKYKFKVVSPAIAQACLESAYGTSTKAQYCNYFGLKYRKNRISTNNGFFNNGGSEQNKDGSYTLLPSDTAWYAFDNMEKGVEGYYQFINIKNYDKVKLATTPEDYLKELKNAGYATDLAYVDKVMAVIKRWNLNKYDKILKEKELKESNMEDINIIKRSAITNTSIKSNRKIDFIVLHYTAGTSSKKGSAQAIATYFGRPVAKASADFIVDDEEIVQYNSNIENRYCWAVGGSKYKNKSNSLSGKFYNICKNVNSISIEMCSNKKNTKSLNANDNDWYLTEKTINNAVKLTKYLMKKYNVPMDHIITHSMVTGKLCPQPWVKNEAALKDWYSFLGKVAGTETSPIPEQPKPAVSTKEYKIKVNTNLLNIRAEASAKAAKKGTIKRGEIYTIIEEKNGFGKLKSGAGWIKLSYTIRV